MLADIAQLVKALHRVASAMEAVARLLHANIEETAKQTSKLTAAHVSPPRPAPGTPISQMTPAQRAQHERFEAAASKLARARAGR